MAKKTIKGLTGVALLLGGAFAWLMFTRKDKAQEALPGDTAPPPSETTGGTETEAPPEMPVAAEPATIGEDRWPRYATAVVSTAKGPELFEKEFDPDLGKFRWINFKNPDYGTYRDITTLVINHPAIRIYTATGAVLWEAGQFTHAGQQFFGLPATAPLAATKA